MITTETHSSNREQSSKDYRRIIGWKRHLMSQSATSICFLNPSRDGDSTTALGSLFQCLTSLSLKKFFLISSLNLP